MAPVVPPATETLHVVHDRPAGKAWGATWVVYAPWAHPIWVHYAVMLYDLVTDLGRPAQRFFAGATHEVVVYVVDPGVVLPHGLDPAHVASLAVLTPPNHGYQFRAVSNEAALARIAALVRRIEARMLSPDEDAGSAWDRLFSDGATLRRLPLAAVAAQGRA